MLKNKLKLPKNISAMRLLKLIFLFIASFSFVPSLAQMVYLTEGFETGAKPTDWIEEYVSGTEPWRYRNGGHSPNDPNWMVPAAEEDITRNPPSAYDGTYNAIFFKQGDNNERTKLITPELDLLGGTNVEVSFYLCQVPWTFEGYTGWDVLRVYYKTSEAGSWVLLHEYLDPIYEWEMQSLLLPNLSSTYYVAFEGHTRWGYGTCIDNVVIQETGYQSLYIGDLDFEQPFVNYTPSGTDDVPMLQVDFNVFGNQDSLILKEIQFTSLNTSDGDILDNGVKLYYTLTQAFSTDSLLGTSTNFSSGIASFTSLNLSLPRGHSYLWLAYDVDLNATHGNILDVKVAPNAILANSSYYPASEQSPIGERVIYETKYKQDFEGIHNWGLSGEFEVATPNGMGGVPGNPNPSEAYRGSYSLGTDLTGKGANPYNYEPALTEATSYTAISPTVDVFYYKNLNLFFWRYLNIEVWDEASIQVSKDNGTTWYTVWENNSYISDFQWTQEQVSIPNQYSKTSNLKFRYKLGPTDPQNNYSGWNVDDVYLTGEFISKDVGVSEWIYPLSGSGHSATDSVRVRISNYGGAEITDPVPVAYSFDGGSNWVTDNMTQTIPVGGNVVFTFPTKVDLTEPGLKPSVLAKTMLSGDQFPENDQLSTQIYIVPTYVVPYTESFETNDGYWRSMGNAIWEYGIPAGDVINSAASGTKSWVTGLNETYEDLMEQKEQTIFEDNFETDLGWTYTGEFERNIPSNMYLPYFAYSGLYCIGTDLSVNYLYENGISDPGYTATSPALDVTNYSNLFITFRSWREIQEGDSIKLEVSTDDGSNWTTLWKNTEGAITDGDYQYEQIFIHDSLSYTSTLRFRFSLFYSSASGPVAAGWNIDDFTLFGDLVNTAAGYLTSPSFDLTGYDHPIIEAKLWLDTEQDVDGATMDYSLDDGETWTNISNSSGYDTYWNWYTDKSVTALGTDDGWSGQSSGWITARHLLPSALINQDNVQVRFRFLADKVINNYDGIAVDDVRIYEAPRDVGVVSIDSPVTCCEQDVTDHVVVTIKNFGLETLKAGETIYVGYDYQTDPSVIDTFTLASDVMKEATFQHTFSQVFNSGLPGSKNITAFTLLPDDNLFYGESLANDTLSKSFDILETPVVDLPHSIYTVRPDTIVLDAETGNPGDTYLWQDASTSPQFNVTDIATAVYWVIVDNGSCTNSDTTYVYRLLADVGISDIIGPVSDCELGSNVIPTVKITNYGTDTLLTGDQFTVAYQLDSDPAVEEILVLSDTLYPGDTLVYTFTTASDMSAVATYSLTAYTDLDYDADAGNDSFNTNVTVYGITPIDLGPPIVIRSTTYVIDAGSGYDSYLWNDNSTNQTLLVDSTGWYSVTVVQGTQCANTDSIHVTLVFPDIKIDEIYSPVSSCGLTSNEIVNLYIKNSGSDTLQVQDTLAFTLQLNAGAVQYDTLFVGSKIFPGDSVLFAFTDPFDLSSVGLYDFAIEVFYRPDSVPANNTINQSIQVYGYPTVSLGPDQVSSLKELTLDAGSGYASYLWQDESTDRYYTVDYDNQTADHLYSVTVTNEYGCPAMDTVQVTFEGITDVVIDSLMNPVNACYLSNQELMKIEIRNTGTVTLSNPQFQVTAIVDEGTPATEQILLSRDFLPNDSLIYTFTKKFDFSTKGDYDVRVSVTYAGDNDSSNDTLVRVISHYVNPTVDLGGANDTLKVTLPYILDAGAGFAVYEWNGVEGSQTLEVTTRGWYTVVVTDLNGCTATDEVFIADLTSVPETRGIEETLLVYPNPTDGFLHIVLEFETVRDMHLEILNGIGQKILIREYPSTINIHDTFDLSGMSKGFYILKLRTKEEEVFRKIIIE